MSLDPAFYELRQKPLPTLPQRRRLVRERLAQEQAELDKYARLAANPLLTPAAADLPRGMVRLKQENIRKLQAALAYLGEPDPRLDLYRLFCMPLPTRQPPTQLRLPLPKPPEKGTP